MNVAPREPQFDHNRSKAIEQLLSDTAEAAPVRGLRMPRRPSARTIIAAIAAFALAGALTGGAVASAATANAGQAAVSASLRAAGQEWIGEQDGTRLGTPIVVSAGSTQIIQLGTAPSGANTVVEAFECIDPGVFKEGLDGRLDSGDDCARASDTYSQSISGTAVTGTGAHTWTVTSPDSARFTVWLAWAHVPALRPSAEEQAELSDGVVTRAEELAAYERYGVCMAALGYPIADEADMQSGMVPLTEVTQAADDSGADNRCYQTQFRGVDGMWALEVEDGTIGVASIEACLSQNGVTPAATPAGRMAQFDALGKGWESCEYAG